MRPQRHEVSRSSSCPVSSSPLDTDERRLPVASGQAQVHTIGGTSEDGECREVVRRAAALLHTHPDCAAVVTTYVVGQLRVPV